MTISGLDLAALALAFGVTVLAGFVKGAVGFAMPTVMISGLASFLSAELALAALIVPTLLTNFWQAFRTGLRPALSVTYKYRRYLLTLLLFIALSAQLVRVLPPAWLFLILGVPISGFALIQLLGWRPGIAADRRGMAEVLVGGLAGALGGVSGVWGPPTVLYLTAANTPKAEQIRVQGVLYGIGAVVLFFAHVQSGVLNRATLPLSLAMVVPALLGMVLGFWVHDRMDQEKFRRATLLVLVVAGLNLVRRGLMLG